MMRPERLFIADEPAASSTSRHGSLIGSIVSNAIDPKGDVVGHSSTMTYREMFIRDAGLPDMPAAKSSILVRNLFRIAEVFAL